MLQFFKTLNSPSIGWISILFKRQTSLDKGMREIQEHSRLFTWIPWRPPAPRPSPRATRQNWTDHLHDWHGTNIAQSQQSLLQSSHCGKVYWFHDLQGLCRYQNHSWRFSSEQYPTRLKKETWYTLFWKEIHFSNYDRKSQHSIPDTKHSTAVLSWRLMYLCMSSWDQLIINSTLHEQCSSGTIMYCGRSQNL